MLMDDRQFIHTVWSRFFGFAPGSRVAARLGPQLGRAAPDWGRPADLLTGRAHSGPAHPRAPARLPAPAKFMPCKWAPGAGRAHCASGINHPARRGEMMTNWPIKLALVLLWPRVKAHRALNQTYGRYSRAQMDRRHGPPLPAALQITLIELVGGRARTPHVHWPAGAPGAPGRDG